MHEQHRILEFQDASRYQCRIFTETMPADDIRNNTMLLQDLSGNDAHREDGRLCIGRQPQIPLRTLEAHLHDRVAQSLIRLFEQALGDIIMVKEILAHADRLRPLSWKYECEFIHLVSPLPKIICNPAGLPQSPVRFPSRYPGESHPPI